MLRFLFLVPVCILVACASKPPIEDYTLARSAIKAAENVQASRYSAGNWHKAQSAYQRGVRYFNKDNFDDAKKYFIKARLYAERAENRARLSRFRSGEAGP